MPQSTLETLAESRSVALVEIVSGAATWRFASGGNDVSLAGATYSAMPMMEADTGLRTGGVKDEPSEFIFDATVEPFGSIISGLYPGMFTVRAGRCDPSNAADTVRWEINHTIESAEPYYKRSGSAVRIIGEGLKSRMGIASVSLPMLPSCVHRFGDSGTCKFDVVAATIDIEIQTVGSPNVNSITATFTGSPDMTPRRWRMGRVTVGGRSDTIRSLSAAGSTVTISLARVPPASWAGAAAKMAPGCDRTLETCRDIHDNEVNRLAPGEGNPGYNPTGELG